MGFIEIGLGDLVRDQAAETVVGAIKGSGEVSFYVFENHITERVVKQDPFKHEIGVEVLKKTADSTDYQQKILFRARLLPEAVHNRKGDFNVGFKVNFFD